MTKPLRPTDVTAAKRTKPRRLDFIVAVVNAFLALPWSREDRLDGRGVPLTSLCWYVGIEDEAELQQVCEGFREAGWHVVEGLGGDDTVFRFPQEGA
jgi:hypothetical protein